MGSLPETLTESPTLSDYTMGVLLKLIKRDTKVVMDDKESGPGLVPSAITLHIRGVPDLALREAMQELLTSNGYMYLTFSEEPLKDGGILTYADISKTAA